MFARVVFASIPLCLIPSSWAETPASPKPGESGPDAGRAPFAAGADGAFRLLARQATVRGRVLRYEPQPAKDTLGYWSDAGDQASWDITVAQPGTFAVSVRQGCGKGSGGSEVEVSVTGSSPPSSVRFTVTDTGHFQNFVLREVGTVTIQSPGRHTVTVAPQKKPATAAAVMDLRELQLVPRAK